MKIGIIGAGSFGTAMAESLSLNTSNTIELFAIEKDIVDSINTIHVNHHYFPGRKLNDNITAHNDLNFIKNVDVIFLTIPSSVVEKVCKSISEFIDETPKIIVNLAKGLSSDGTTLNVAIKKYFSSKHQVCSLKGPTFAIELLNGVPSALTLAAETNQVYESFISIFKNTNIRIDFTKDIKGVELLSVLKNIYAIAIGIVGAKFNSPNVNFMIFTKAYKEIRMIMNYFNCQEETASLYCGIGDLGLTALNDLSRNRTLGLFIGKGFYDGHSSSGVVLEGLRSIKLFAIKLAKQDKYKTALPILFNLNDLIANKISKDNFVNVILTEDKLIMRK